MVPIPMVAQVALTASGRTTAAMLRIMFHGSIRNGTPTTPATRHTTYSNRICNDTLERGR